MSLLVCLNLCILVSYSIFLPRLILFILIPSSCTFFHLVCSFPLIILLSAFCLTCFNTPFSLLLYPLNPRCSPSLLPFCLLFPLLFLLFHLVLLSSDFHVFFIPPPYRCPCLPAPHRFLTLLPLPHVSPLSPSKPQVSRREPRNPHFPLNASLPLNDLPIACIIQDNIKDKNVRVKTLS